MLEKVEVTRSGEFEMGLLEPCRGRSNFLPHDRAKNRESLGQISPTPYVKIATTSYLVTYYPTT